ncbi:MAG TPA: L-seryl-tRNA(Sec) selenium transferase, partial [Acidobacteriota bacterium]|nr:L-seryl-tRNA(Sec) selenium transferase [Acidobacteriota bacterium]
VNNNAAALLLILNTFAEGKEVLVSRGELVEIGGSFRLPEIMKRSGAILREIGTTNKTRLEDYSKAISERTGLILVVHPSNYQIIGFTERPSLKSIAVLGKHHSIPVVEDHGSGILFDLTEAGIPEESNVAARIEEGIDLICFSGDKILGGPQAGIVCGLKARVEALRKNPLFRALRVDKMVYAALEATLLLYLRGEKEKIPVLQMLFEPLELLQQRAKNWLSQLQSRFPESSWRIESTLNYIGGGVAPMKGLPSCAVSLKHPVMTSEQLARALRESDIPVIARIEEERLFFELRTLTVQEEEGIALALKKIFEP